MIDAQEWEAMSMLPNRAAKLMINAPLHPANSEKVWSSVWNQKQKEALKLDANEVDEAIQAQRVSNKHNKKKKKSSSATSSRRRARPGRAKSLTNWLSNLKMGGMVESEVNTISREALMGKGYQEKKKASKN